VTRLNRTLAVLVAVVTAAGLTACGGDGGDEGATTTVAPTTTAAGDGTTTTAPGGVPALSQSCTHEDRDVRVVVRYPDGWHANPGDPVPACTAFDPDPFELRAGTEFPRDLAVVLRVEPLAYARAIAPTGLGVEERRDRTVDGRRAARVVVVSTGEGLGPPGVRSLRYVIDAGRERSIIAETFEAEGNDFERSVAVLDAMVTALDVEPRAG
jgi:hypothetical protein